MTNTDPNIDDIAAQLREEETQWRRRTWIFTAVPIIVGVIVLIVAFWGVTKARDEVKHLEATADSLNNFLAEVEGRLTIMRDSTACLLGLMESLRTKIDADVAEQASREATQAFQAKGRVYLHIWSEEQRDKAGDVAAYLEEDGFVVPGIELVRTVLPKSQLRFFRQREEEEATRIQELCQTNGYPMELNYLSRYENSTKIRPRHYEIWFGDDF